MKGDVSSIFQTVILSLIMVAVIIAAFTIMVFFQVYQLYGGENTFQLIGINNRPYSIIESLTSFKPNDRSFLENALEASITGALTKSNSQNIPLPVTDFLNFYSLKSYQVVIGKGENNIFTANNFVTTCGEGKGMCTASAGRGSNPCGEGREQLSDRSACSRDQVCCSFAVSQDAKKCGGNLNGVCTAAPVGALTPSLSCGEGRQVINDNGQCRVTEVCCKYTDPIDIGIASNAEMPLVYKGEKVGQITVGVSRT
ncbi:MAG: hypothetical protein HYU56_04510 [Candidatus Aenigmarchaeota archaeon]|nr:hypothetical protein [Candidatus Aenigmarchaeota archaeon]